MRKQDLKVGEEYAVGSSSGYAKWNLARARLVELDGERRASRSFGGTYMKRGIVVALVVDVPGYSQYTGDAGKEFVLDSARDIQSLWAPYAERKAEYDVKMAERDAERDRRMEVAREVELRMRALSVYEGVRRSIGTGDFTVPPDTMARIVAMIPDAV